MASINDYGGADPDTLASPPLGGPDGWAAAVAAALDGRDETVDTRITAATASMATDAEVAAAVTAHEAAADPHPGYLTPAEHAALDHTGLPGVGSGGGGGASALNDLTDVEAANPSNGQVLAYESGEAWVGAPVSTSASGAADGGSIDGVWDGNPSTFWQNNSSGTKWARADFGTPITVTRVETISSNAGETWQLQWSDDNVDWTNVGSQLPNTNAAPVQATSFPAETHRYWRLSGLGGGWCQIRANLYNTSAAWKSKTLIPPFTAADAGEVLAINATGTGLEWDALPTVTAHEAAADPHPGYLTPAEHAAIDHTGLPGVGSGGGASKLDDLTDVSAPAATPAGKVLGTTAQGVWGPVDPPSGGGGGTTFEFWAYVDRNSTKLSKFIATGPGLQASPPYVQFAQRLSGASVAFTLPTIETGDLLIVAAKWGSGSGVAPTGFRLLNYRSLVYYRYLSAVKAVTPADSGTTLTVAVAASQTDAILLVVRGSTGDVNHVEYGGEDADTSVRSTVDPPVFVPTYGTAAWLWLSVIGVNQTGKQATQNPGILAVQDTGGVFIAYLSSTSADRIDPTPWTIDGGYLGTHTIGIRGA